MSDQTHRRDDIWRRLLWQRHGCDPAGQYGDDGEMQCSICLVDFRRWAPEAIDAHWRSVAALRMSKEHPDE